MAATQGTQNKKLVHHILTEVWQRKNVDAVDELFAEDVVVRATRTGSDGRVMRRDDLKERFREWHEAFPDANIESHAIVCEDDVVVNYGTLYGTHDGSFRDIEPTHRPVEMSAFALYRIRDGQVVEYTAIGELSKLLKQLSAETPAES